MININAALNNLGYGVASLNILVELSKLGKVSYFPIDPRFRQLLKTRNLGILPEYYPIVETCYQNHESYNYKDPCLKIWHEGELYEWIGRGKKIGFPFFELDRFTKPVAHSLGVCDLILTASEWGKSILESIKVPVEVVPLGVDTKIFYPKEDKQEKFIFCNIGKTEVRKGHDILCEAFNKAFTDKDDVELWVVWDNPFYTEDEKREWNNYYLTSTLGKKIKILPRVNTQHDLARLINKTNCGVFPYRAEAWNLEVLEFMACGKQVIATNYSGPTQYLNQDNAFLLNTKSLEPAYDGKWFFNQGNWCKVSDCMDQLVEHMRFVYKFGKFNHEGITTARKFSWQESAKKIQMLLS